MRSQAILRQDGFSFGHCVITAIVLTRARDGIGRTYGSDIEFLKVFKLLDTTVVPVAYPKTVGFGKALPVFRFSNQLNLYVVPFDLHTKELMPSALALPLITRGANALKAPGCIRVEDTSIEIPTLSAACACLSTCKLVYHQDKIGPGHTGISMTTPPRPHALLATGNWSDELELSSCQV